jgi:hypothetical protein
MLNRPSRTSGSRVFVSHNISGSSTCFFRRLINTPVDVAATNTAMVNTTIALMRVLLEQLDLNCFLFSIASPSTVVSLVKLFLGSTFGLTK